MSHVKECYEPLVDIVAHPKILYNETTIEKPVLLRREVANKLYKIADKLPDDIYIKNITKKKESFSSENF